MKKQNKQKRKKPSAKTRIKGMSQDTRGVGGAIKPANVDALVRQGTEALQRGELSAAETLFRRVLDISPDHADAHNLMGVVALSAQQSDIAAQYFNAALSLNRNSPDYAYNLSLALLSAGDVEGAERAAHSALILRPDYAAAWNTLGLTFKQRGRWEDARNAFEKALSIKPDSGEAWINQCGTFQELGLKDEALDAGKHGVRLSPKAPEAHYNYAGALADLECYDEAATAYKNAITLRPEYADAYINLSHVYTDMGRYAEAEALARKAIELAPGNYSGHSNLGLALCHQGALREGIEAYYRARDLAPDAAEPHTNLAFALLALEEFSTGWDEYEYAFLSGSRIPHVRSPTPIWEGQPLEGKTIHIYGEQAIGDHILYATMIQHVLAQGARVIYEVERRLVPLFKRSFPEMTILELSIPPDMAARDPNEDYHISVGSLGRFFRRSVDAFEPQGKFLEPDPELVKRYRDSYAQLGDGPVIGIAWKSRSSSYADKKNIPLGLWAPILKTPGCTFVSLQYGEVEKDINWVKKEFGVDIHIDESVSALNSLEQCAAQTAAVDLVISISNATIHFAAGCGTETWVLTGRPTMWHWFTEREDSLWYKTVRLFRLKEGEDWPVIIERAAGDLKKYLANCVQ